MTRADAMRGSWWWIFDIIFSLKLMWDSQNDIYNYNFRPCPCTASRFDSQFELSRGKWSHFPLSKIRVQPARMILIIILIFAYYIIFQWKNVKNITFKQESNYEKFYENSWNQVIKFYPEFNLDITENGQRGIKWYCITVILHHKPTPIVTKFTETD